MQNKIQSIIEINNHKLKQCVTLIDNFPTLDLNLNIDKASAKSHVLHNLIESYEYDVVGASVLKDVIFNNVKQELIFSSKEETRLLKQIIADGGYYSPRTLPEIFAAKNLILRMICSKNLSDNRFYLNLDEHVLGKIKEVLQDHDYIVQHEIFLKYLRNCDALLYYIGFMPLYLMVENFINDFKSFGKPEEYYYNLILRYVYSHYRSLKMDNQSMIIVHEGWSNLIDLNKRFEGQDGFAVDMTEDLFEIASTNILPNEVLYDSNFIRAISGAVHTHLSASEVSYSMRLLIKQGLSLTEVKSVLRPMLITSLSVFQERALKDLYNNTTRWISLTSKNLN